MSLERQLAEAKIFIRDRVAASGLDGYEVVFEMVDADQMNAVAAYGGFPNRYPHWRFGMEYERLNKTYTYGFSKIYEMVVNNDPCYAYLMRANSLVEQKLVMAHVYGHSDFFKNSVFFAHTNRKMMDQAGTHRSKIQRLMMRYGQDRIEDFIDLCLSLETLVDLHHPKRRPHVAKELDFNAAPLPSAEAKDPSAALSAEGDEISSRNRTRPEKDILLFLLEHAPLQDWQQEVLGIPSPEVQRAWVATRGDTPRL